VAETAASEPATPQAGPFERDTAVSLREQDGQRRRFEAIVSPDWRAGRGPHGGYLAAMLLRALAQTVDEPTRAPRSLTIHYARPPVPGEVLIHTTIERAGRSLSTLSARMEQDGSLVALALGAFSVPWQGEQHSELPLPALAREQPPTTQGGNASRVPGTPAFTEHLVVQPRVEGRPFDGAKRPMELAAWVGLVEARPLDALALAFFCDALMPAPFMRLDQPVAAPTVDLTIHFRATLPRTGDPDPHELCFARVKAGLIQEGFFEEDVVIWAADGTVLAQSRQLAILLPMSAR
jgi:acyl-CoA thioesterase